MAVTALMPQVSYGPGPTVFQFTLPMKPWDLRGKTVGGYGVASSGVPESLIIRRERWLMTTLRFYETQLPNVLDWVEWCQDNAGSFTFRLNKTDAATDYLVYLENPHLTDDVDYKRNTDYVGAYELAITIRTANATRFLTTIL